MMNWNIDEECKMSFAYIRKAMDLVWGLGDAHLMLI